MSLLDVIDEVVYEHKTVSVPVYSSVSDPHLLETLDQEEFVEWLEEKLSSPQHLRKVRYSIEKHQNPNFSGRLVLSIPYFLWQDLYQHFDDPKRALAEFLKLYLLEKLRKDFRLSAGPEVGVYLCPVCKTMSVVPDTASGFYVCKNCGVVIEHPVTAGDTAVEPNKLEHIDKKSLDMDSKAKQIYSVLKRLFPNTEATELQGYAEAVARYMECLERQVRDMGLMLKKTPLYRLQWVLRSIAIHEMLSHMPRCPDLEQIVKANKTKYRKKDLTQVELVREMLRERGVLEKCRG